MCNEIRDYVVASPRSRLVELCAQTVVGSIPVGNKKSEICHFVSDSEISCFAE